MRTDHGAEFQGEFIKLCAQLRRSHKFLPLRTPQPNGVVERNNETLENKVRALLHENDLLKCFWTAVEYYELYYEQMLIRSILKKTPCELF